MKSIDCTIVNTLIGAHVHCPVPDARPSITIVRIIRCPAPVRSRVYAGRIDAQVIVARIVVRSISTAIGDKRGIIYDISGCPDIIGWRCATICKTDRTAPICADGRIIEIYDAVIHFACAHPAAGHSRIIADNRAVILGASASSAASILRIITDYLAVIQDAILRSAAVSCVGTGRLIADQRAVIQGAGANAAASICSRYRIANYHAIIHGAFVRGGTRRIANQRAIRQDALVRGAPESIITKIIAQCAVIQRACVCSGAFL